ncbi:MAG TPA: hypothetical protein VM327_07555 [Candidatus Thermoplasmatota archaeon]|nr:hypothetical protein [Candidatus Thermoplasmatota archaeon]
MRAWWFRVAVACAALAFVPVGSAQLSNPDTPTPTTLYFHIFDTYNPFPVNTQAMDVGFFAVSGTNFPTIASQGYDFNTIRGFSTSGPVEYGFLENGRPRYHPERGIAADVRIDPAVQPVAYLYLDVRDVFGSDAEGLGLPQVLPSFTVRVTMRTGNEIGPDADLDAGTLVMGGQRTAHVTDGHLAPTNGAVGGQTAPDGNPILVPDEAGVIEFAVPLDISQPLIPKSDSFNLRIDWYQNPTGDPSQDDQYAEGWMRLVLDEAHLPRLEMSILNPVYIDFIHPQVAAGTLLVHAGVNSPWGTYDVDVANLSLAIQGPAEPQDLGLVVSQNAHVHGLHDKAAEVTWLWRFRDEDAPSGDYTILLKVPNMAGSSTAEGQAGFTIEGKKAYGLDETGEVIEPVQDSGGKSSPAPGLLMPLVVAGLAAALRSRRLG